MNNKFRNYRLVYRQNGETRVKPYTNTLYDNVQRVAESFPPSVLWRILPA